MSPWAGLEDADSDYKHEEIGPGNPSRTGCGSRSPFYNAIKPQLQSWETFCCWTCGRHTAGLLQTDGSWAPGFVPLNGDVFSGLAELHWAVLAQWIHANLAQEATTSARCAVCPTVAARLGCAHSTEERLLCLSLSSHLVLMSVTTAEPMNCP